MTDLPELYQTRLVTLKGVETLAYDFARQDGSPVAVVGPNAVKCPKCGAAVTEPCETPSSQPSLYTHMERQKAMRAEMVRLTEASDGA